MRPLAHLADGCAAMGAGLALDATRIAPAALLATCATGSGMLDALRLHLLAMPCSMVAMLLPLALRRGRQPFADALADTAAMGAGMLLGSRAALPLHALGDPARARSVRRAAQDGPIARRTGPR